MRGLHPRRSSDVKRSLDIDGPTRARRIHKDKLDCTSIQRNCCSPVLVKDPARFHWQYLRADPRNSRQGPTLDPAEAAHSSENVL